VLCSPLLRVHLLIDATHALLTYALVVSVNTGTAEYTFTVQHNTYLFRTLTPCDRYTVVVCPMGIILSVESLRHATEGGCAHSFVCHGALTSVGGSERPILS